MFAPTELYNDGKHICVSFSDLVSEGQSEAVQANQFLIIDNGDAALIDPGGNMTYHALYTAMSRYFPPKQLRYVLASHADPDIIASLARWLGGTECKLAISSIWSRFVPHFCTGTRTEGRIIGIKDEGGLLPLGRSHVHVIPAHFLHSEGNFQFYDPISKILFSGDLGASLMPPSVCGQAVKDFARHIPQMEGFHRRYGLEQGLSPLGAHGAPARHRHHRPPAWSVLSGQADWQAVHRLGRRPRLRRRSRIGSELHAAAGTHLIVRRRA